MRSIIGRLRRDIALTGNAAARTDPLLTTARILLWIAMAMTIVGIVVVALAAVVFLSTRPSLLHNIPAWWRALGYLVALIALWTTGEILARLLELVGSVADGEPFAPVNARRIEAVALGVLGLQVLGFCARLAGVPVRGNINGVDLMADLSPGGIALVLILFILARVFREGARLAEDDAATV